MQVCNSEDKSKDQYKPQFKLKHSIQTVFWKNSSHCKSHLQLMSALIYTYIHTCHTRAPPASPARSAAAAAATATLPKAHTGPSPAASQQPEALSSHSHSCATVLSHPHRLTAHPWGSQEPSEQSALVSQEVFSASFLKRIQKCWLLGVSSSKGARSFKFEAFLSTMPGIQMCIFLNNIAHKNNLKTL